MADTVGELIRELSRYSPDTPVRTRPAGGGAEGSIARVVYADDLAGWPTPDTLYLET